MKRRLTWFIAFLSLTGCLSAPPVTTPTGTDSAVPKQFVGRQILVTLAQANQPQWPIIRAAIGREYDLELSGEFPLTSIDVNCLVYIVPPHVSMAELLSELRRDQRVVWAQENQVFSGLQAENNPIYAELSYAPKLMHLAAAHRILTGKGVKIAIIDTGADQRHPDLQNRNIAISNFVEGGDLSFAEDRHGTAVAGIIGAQTNNGIGIDGVAPNAKISVLKSCWYEPSGTGAQCSSWTLAKALDAAINDGVQIINLSLAGPYDELLKDLLEAANRSGITIVTASLDKATEPGFPAQLPAVIPAVSVGPDGSVKIPAWLPGLQKVAAAPGIEIVTTTPHGAYDIMSGTSLAAAHITGVAALLLEHDPTLSPTAIKRILTADSLAPGGYRSIDVCRILTQTAQLNQCID